MLVKVICRMLVAVAASMSLTWWQMTALVSPSLEIREEFDHLGVRFIRVDHQIDTDSPVGRAMFTIIGAMAELESSLISERVTAGMRAAEARGKHLGRPATHHASSRRSRRSPGRRTSASGRFKRCSEVAPVAASSARSRNERARRRLRPCAHFPVPNPRGADDSKCRLRALVPCFQGVD